MDGLLFVLLFDWSEFNVIVCLIWSGGETVVVADCWLLLLFELLDELAMLLEAAKLFDCWFVPPLIAACKIGVEDCKRLRLDDEDCGDEMNWTWRQY